MDNGPHKAEREEEPARLPHVDALASAVLSIVAKKSHLSDSARLRSLVDRLCDAVRDYDATARARMMAELAALDIHPVEITEVLIPAAARKLGEDWCSDALSFADVTIGAARLQAMLREMTDEILAGVVVPQNAPHVLIAVRCNEFHTLGALVLSSHFRRRGVVVRLSLGQSDGEIAQIIDSGDYDAAMISASGGETLESLRNLVKIIRNGTEDAPPILLGGSVLEQKKDVKTLTGADYVTNDPDEALRLCGLKVPDRGVTTPPIEA
ncbi:MAG: cobalamin-dependent protein [Pseudomonadota bacterium]